MKFPDRFFWGVIKTMRRTLRVTLIVYGGGGGGEGKGTRCCLSKLLLCPLHRFSCVKVNYVSTWWGFFFPPPPPSWEVNINSPPPSPHGRWKKKKALFLSDTQAGLSAEAGFLNPPPPHNMYIIQSGFCNEIGEKVLKLTLMEYCIYLSFQTSENPASARIICG